MVKHIVMWSFHEQIPQEERLQKGQELKEAIEALADIISGVQQLRVEIVPVGTSTHHILLEGQFDSLEALQHAAVSGASCTCVRGTETAAGGRKSCLLRLRGIGSAWLSEFRNNKKSFLYHITTNTFNRKYEQQKSGFNQRPHQGRNP